MSRDVPLCIPTIFTLAKAESRRRWRSLCRRAVKAGSWSAVSSEIELVPIGMVEGRVIVTDGYVDRWDQGADFGHMVSVLNDACEQGLNPFDKEERKIWYERIRDLVVEGADEGWFCLGILAHQGAPLFPATDAETTEGPKVAAALVRKIVRWWPTFVAHGDRFQRSDTINVPPRACDSWLRWGQVLVRLCAYFGMPDEEWLKLQELSATEVAVEVERLAARVLKRGA